MHVISAPGKPVFVDEKNPSGLEGEFLYLRAVIERWPIL